MPASALWENIFATISLICWSIHLVPQVWLNFKRKSTAGMSVEMVGCWYTGSMLLNPFGLYRELAIPLIIQSHTFSFFAMTCVLQHYWYDGALRPFKIKYPPAPEETRPRHWRAATIAFLITAFYWVGVELGVLMALRASNSEVLIACIALTPLVFSVSGIISQVVASIRQKSTHGLSKFALWLDFAGGVTGVLSLFFREGPFDYLAAGIYITVTVGTMCLIGVTFYYRNASKIFDEVIDNPTQIQEVTADTFIKGSTEPIKEDV